MTKANATYSELEISTEVMGASAHRLIQMLLEKCLQHIELSKTYISVNDIKNKGQSISKAWDIAEYLRLCLNQQDEKAQELSSQLSSLYLFMQSNLIQANITNDVSYLDKAKNVLLDIKAGWDGIAR